MSAELLDQEQKMAAFARSFPSVSRHASAMLWDANSLDAWATEMPVSHGELVTVQFLLAVWDPERNWRCGRFELMAALRTWDERHRKAFAAWVADPWWP